MCYKHTYDTIYTHFQGITNNIYGLGRLFLLLHFVSVHPYFCPSIFVFTRPNDRWTGLYMKLLSEQCRSVTCLWGVSERRRSTDEDVGAAALPAGVETSHAAAAVAGTRCPRDCHAQSPQPTQVGSRLHSSGRHSGESSLHTLNRTNSWH